MPRTSDKRDRLLHAADRLVLAQGCKQTTLADIARESGVPLGNVYYYFRTKQDICAAVVDSRVDAMREVLEACEREPDPRQRLLCFLDYPLSHRQALREHGCPLGSLASELSKSGTLKDQSARLVGLLRNWAQTQFEAMGVADAPALALEYTALLQGTSLLAHTLDDESVVEPLVSRLRARIQAL